LRFIVNGGSEIFCFGSAGAFEITDVFMRITDQR
jgi:hypothetical protein